MNFQWFNQAETETWFWFCSEPLNNSVQCPVPSFLNVMSSVQSLASRVQRPESSVQSPESNTWVQSPGIPVSRSEVTRWNFLSKSLKNTSGKFIFSKVAGFYPAILLKINLKRDIFQGFWL